MVLGTKRRRCWGSQLQWHQFPCLRNSSEEDVDFGMAVLGGWFGWTPIHKRDRLVHGRHLSPLVRAAWRELSLESTVKLKYLLTSLVRKMLTTFKAQGSPSLTLGTPQWGSCHICCAGICRITGEVSDAAQGMGSCLLNVLTWEISAVFSTKTLQIHSHSKREDEGLHLPCLGVNHYKSIIQHLYSR